MAAFGNAVSDRRADSDGAPERQVLTVACPRCGAKPGEYCKSPRGTRFCIMNTHIGRFRVLSEKRRLQGVRIARPAVVSTVADR